MKAQLGKVFADARVHYRRAALAVIAIAVGTAAITTALSGRAVLAREVATSFNSSRPASATLWLDRVDDDLLAQVRALEGIRDADARRLVRARVEVARGEWLPLLLYGVRDFRDLRVSTFSPVSGDSPPRDGEVLVERSALGVLATNTGETLPIRVPGGRLEAVRVGGIVHDPGQAPGWQDHEGYAYTTPATLARLGLGSELDELRLMTVGDRASAEAAAMRVSEWLSARGRAPHRVEVHAVEHPHADHMQVVVTLLSAFALLALLLAGSLTLTVMSALLARQVREIGAMKTMGATTGQIARIYFAFALLLAGAGALVGFLVGSILAQRFVAFAGAQLNLQFTSFAVPLGVLAAEFLIGAGVPVAASAFPILKACRMSVRDAIQSVGITESYAQLSQTGSSVINVERRLAWRNLRRRPARLVSTLMALALGGAALMTAQNVHRGLIGTVDAALTARGDDVDVRLLRGATRAEIEAAVRAVPGVTYVEGWGSTLASIRLGESSDELSIGTTRYPVSAPPSDSRMPRPRLVEGRRFDVDASGEAVMSRGLLDRETHLRVGADVVLLTAGRTTHVRIVGVIEEVGAPGLYVSPATMTELVGSPDQTGALRLTVGAGEQAQVASAVEELLVDRGWFPLAVMTRDNLRAAMVDHFLIMLALLSSAAIAALIVGALSLATSIGLNVLERSREIGVMRAIGASDGRIRRLLFTEGAILCVLSVGLAIVVSLPFTALVQRVVGEHGLHVTMPFSVSVQAFVAWAVAAALVLVLASLLPARTALLSPVREVLAQE